LTGVRYLRPDRRPTCDTIAKPGIHPAMWLVTRFVTRLLKRATPLGMGICAWYSRRLLLRNVPEEAGDSTVTVFGTALEITLAELAIEAFYPRDDETSETLLSIGR